MLIDSQGVAYGKEQDDHVTFGQALDVAEMGFTLAQFKKANVNWFSGAIFGKTAAAAAGIPSMFQVFGKLAPIDIGLSALTARRKHKASAALGAALTQSLNFGVAVVGNMLGGPILALAATMITDPLIRNIVGPGIQKAVELGSDLRKIKMGGDYEDTPYAHTMRQRAAQELGSSLLNARQYLGKEGLLFHQ